MKIDAKKKIQLKRKKRVRKKVSGTAERPRMNVCRSSNHVYVQVIDDDAGKTVVAANSYEAKRATIAVCKNLGIELGKKCLELKIKQIVFDKNGFAYHGRIKAVAEGAREAGLNF